MAFIVLALGALMAVAGSYEVYFGNTYISVERGWSAFISGTVLLTGGLVTVALGLAMRSLAEIRAALVGAGVPQLSAAPNIATLDRAEPVPSLDAANAAPHHNDVGLSLGEQIAEEPMLPTPPVLAPTPEPIAAPTRAATSTVTAPPVASVEQPTVDLPEVEPPASEDEPAPRLRPGMLAETTRPSRSVFNIRLERTVASGAADEPASDWRRERAVPQPQAEEPVAAAQTSSTDPSPPADDWLDRSFADLERDMAAGRIRPTLSREPTRNSSERTQPVGFAEAAEMAPSYEGQVASVDPNLPAVAMPHSRSLAREALAPPLANVSPLPPATIPASPVIGRYESDGTSYVMYADGSIEAQSEAGVYRFASMSELKSFLET